MIVVFYLKICVGNLNKIQRGKHNKKTTLEVLTMLLIWVQKKNVSVMMAYELSVFFSLFNTPSFS